jgi:tRNA U55 pseudouridine synthase TruB
MKTFFTKVNIITALSTSLVCAGVTTYVYVRERRPVSEPWVKYQSMIRTEQRRLKIQQRAMREQLESKLVALHLVCADGAVVRKMEVDIAPSTEIKRKP